MNWGKCGHMPSIKQLRALAFEFSLGLLRRHAAQDEFLKPLHPSPIARDLISVEAQTAKLSKWPSEEGDKREWKRQREGPDDERCWKHPEEMKWREAEQRNDTDSQKHECGHIRGLLLDSSPCSDIGPNGIGPGQAYEEADCP